jgi:TolB-like protein/tetratricopeptide (TPR) repeat protein
MLPMARFGFDAFELDIESGELRKNGGPLKLQLQPFKVLAFLVAHAGQTVTREEIRRHVWGGDTFVDYEQGLNYCIRQIRAALGEDTAKPSFIETYPRRGYRFLRPVQELPRGESKSEEPIVLAVLPLENFSGNQEQEYFADGLTDELITEVSNVSPQRLRVIARTSSMQYKRTTKGIDLIGRELGVDYIVEGSVRRAGNRVRITAQLIRVSDQTHVWARSYERELQDVLLLQSEVAATIASEVQVKLVTEPRPAAAEYRVNPEAYVACLKARFLWGRRTGDDLYRALEMFSKAIEKAPNYAPAFAGLADTYLVFLDHRQIAPHEALALATAAATNALRLDERLADAHTALGHAKLHELEWDAAEREFQRAIQLNPGYAPAHFYCASLLCGRGRFDAGVAAARESLKLDPVSTAAEARLARLLYIAGRLEEALESNRKVIEKAPNVPIAYDDRGRMLLAKGAWPEAIAALEKAVALSHRSGRYLASLGYAWGVTGRVDLARGILAELTAASQQRHVESFDFALVNAGLGDRDEAISWLERACTERDSHLPLLAVDPRLASLLTEPRFEALLKSIGLSQAPR